MVPLSLSIELPELPALSAVQGPVLALAGEDLVTEMESDWYSIDRWRYAGRSPRPTYSPAQSEWTAEVEDKTLTLLNKAEKRKGGTYVGFIHYAGTARSDTVLSRIERDRLPEWTERIAESIAEGWCEAVNRG